MTETYIESERLPFPRLVCASKHCTETRPGIDGLGRIWYKSICHEPYEFTTSTRQYFGNPDFANAPVMNKKGKCRKCKCPYQMHMVTDHKMVEKTREPVDEDEEKANDQTTTEVEDAKEPETNETNDVAEIKVLVIPTSSTSESSSPRGGIKSMVFTFGHISPESIKLPKFSDALTELDLQPKSPKRKEIEEVREGSVYSNVQTPPASASRKFGYEQTAEYHQILSLIDAITQKDKCKRWLENNSFDSIQEPQSTRSFNRFTRLLAGAVLRIKRQFRRVSTPRLT